MRAFFLGNGFRAGDRAARLRRAVVRRHLGRVGRGPRWNGPTRSSPPRGPAVLRAAAEQQQPTSRSRSRTPDRTLQTHRLSHRARTPSKYADYAIGRSRSRPTWEPYYADNRVRRSRRPRRRVKGAPLVPVERFRCGGGNHPDRGVAGPARTTGSPARSNWTHAAGPHGDQTTGPDGRGRNLLRLPDDDPGRALMQYG